MRSCSRTGCRWPAASSLSFRYASRQVWLLDLCDPDPALYDLCPHHADTLVVPRGWHRVDQRTETPAVHEPWAQELVARPGRVPVPDHRSSVPDHRPPIPDSRAPVPQEHRAPPAPSHPRRTPPPKPAAPRPAPPKPVRVNRYEGLHRDLPRLAAEMAELWDAPGAEASRPVGAEPGVIVPIDAARRGPSPTGSPLNA